MAPPSDAQRTAPPRLLEEQFIKPQLINEPLMPLQSIALPDSEVEQFSKLQFITAPFTPSTWMPLSVKFLKSEPHTFPLSANK